MKYILALLALLLIITTASAVGGPQTVGLLINKPEAFDGYTLFSPLGTDDAYLLDNNGEVVHSWTGIPGGAAPYLLDDGSIIRMGSDVVTRLAWDGTLLWFYTAPTGFLHHDIEPLPNGNFLLILSESKPKAQAIAAGRNPNLISGATIDTESIIEVQPTGVTTGNIVWTWNAWDHLIQDYDPAQANYGVVADHPELIDINFFDSSRPPDGEPDWLHANSVAYNSSLDQIILTVRHFSEFWVIDRSSNAIVYRWGSPAAFRSSESQQLFLPHDANWTDEKNIIVFNNGPRPAGHFSSIEEIDPPASGFAVVNPVWHYEATGFISETMSGMRRLPNGNTLITEAESGHIFEVLTDGRVVWSYVNPQTPLGIVVQGEIPPTDPGNFVFKAFKYPPSHPGLQGRDLTPRGTLEGDADQDGCADKREQELAMDPLYHWDFYDVWTHPINDPVGWERNSVINIPDITTVANHFGPSGIFPTLSKEAALANALTPPADEFVYNAAYDRGPLLTTPDGVINIPDDILGIAGEFGVSCFQP